MNTASTLARAGTAVVLPTPARAGIRILYSSESFGAGSSCEAVTCNHERATQRLVPSDTQCTFVTLEEPNSKLLLEYLKTMADFTTLFAIALVICAIATFLSSDIYKKMSGKVSTGDEEGITPEITAKHNNLLKKYLFIYLLATLSDWLQGPYVYALYMDYGFEQHEIAQLFVAGFGSSMIFGSFVGGMADWGGRRNFVVIFALVYAASCITKRKCDQASDDSN